MSNSERKKSWWLPSRERQQYEEKKVAFNQKYGNDLGDFAEAYANRAGTIGGWVSLRGLQVRVEEIRTIYSEALVEKLETQSPETRNIWLEDFFKDLDELVPPTKGQINLNF